MMALAQRSAVGSILFEMKFWLRYILPTQYLAVYYPTPNQTVDRMLSLAECTDKDTVFDLGCGDGRVLVAAGKLGARAVGYELDSELCQAAQLNIQQAGLQERCRVLNKDASTADVSSATIIALYLSDRGNRELMHKLSGTLRPGTRVVSNFFAVQGWEHMLQRTCTADPTTGPIHLYHYKQANT